MDCERTRSAISARLDGEDAGVAPEALTAHLGTCPSCRDFELQAAAMHRQVRVAPAPPVPDLTARILSAIGASDEAPAQSHVDAWRVALACIAIIQIGLAVPALFLGSDAGLPVHTARHIGSFSIALAVGFLFAAWRPSRVSGLFPVAAALVACLVITSIVDVTSGRAAAGNEVSHVTELLGLALLWVVGRSTHQERSTTSHTVAPGPA
jgi:predicted anti-sigma-YlaC factor YlaD